MSVETTPLCCQHQIPDAVRKLPRVAWLAYWFATMAVTIPLAHIRTRISSTTSPPRAHLSRKWFHGIAVLLFAPATVAVPQLMSLSYAVALALLLLLEATRHSVPWLNDFYGRYLDADGKGETSAQHQIVVSHMALVAGCAVPLWIGQYRWTMGVDDDGDSQRLLLSLWGVWVTGVGDAMGAVVGQTVGRMQWGQQRRTVEGSLAMLVSLCAVCALTARFAGGRGAGVECVAARVHLCDVAGSLYAAD